MTCEYIIITNIAEGTVWRRRQRQQRCRVPIIITMTIGSIIIIIINEYKYKWENCHRKRRPFHFDSGRYKTLANNIDCNQTSFHLHGTPTTTTTSTTVPKTTSMIVVGVKFPFTRRTATRNSAKQQIVRYQFRRSPFHSSFRCRSPCQRTANKKQSNVFSVFGGGGDDGIGDGDGAAASQTSNMARILVLRKVQKYLPSMSRCCVALTG